MRLFGCSHKNNNKTFWYYSHNILILLRSKKDPQNIWYFCINSLKMNEQSFVNFELDKTVEKGSFIKRQTSGASNDSKWYNKWQRMTTNDNAWCNKNISLTTVFAVDCFLSFWLINTASLISCLLHPYFFLSNFSQIALFNEILNSYLIQKCDICEVLEVKCECVRLKPCSHLWDYLILMYILMRIYNFIGGNALNDLKKNYNFS